MKKDITDIVLEKEFIELTPSEREELKEFCSTEEEYNQMKSVFIGVSSIPFETPQPKKETKESLDQLFHETYPKSAPLWYSSILSVVVPKDKPIYRQPLVQIAAVVILIVLIVPFYNNDIVQPSNQLAQNESTSTLNESDKNVSNSEEELNELNESEIVNQNQGSLEELPELILAEEMAPSTSVTFSSSRTDLTIDELTASASTGAGHPDGIFVGDMEGLSLSLPASESTDLLDVLTATF